MKKLLLILAAFTLVSCGKKIEVELTSLGIEETDYVLDYTGGEVVLQVLSDGEFTLAFDDPAANWLTFAEDPENRVFVGKDDMNITLVASSNSALLRKTTLTLSHKERVIHVTVYQRSIYSSEVVSFDENVTFSGAAGRYYSSFLTTVPHERISLEVSYLQGAASWITSVEFVNNKICYTIRENASGASRTAVLKVSLTNAWGEDLSQIINLTQESL